MSMMSKYGPYASGYQFPDQGGYPLSPTDYGSAEEAGRFGRRRRRMNPLNGRAAFRALRRIKAVRKLLHGIERHLPKVRPKVHFFHPRHRRR